MLRSSQEGCAALQVNVDIVDRKAVKVSPVGGASLAGLLEGAGAVGIFIAAYTPWVVTFAFFTFVPVRGIETPYGRIIALAPLVALGLLAWRWYIGRAWWIHVIIIILGICVAGLAIMYAIDARRNLVRAQQSLIRAGQVLPGTVRVNFDVGIYLTAAGAASMVAGGVLGFRQDRVPGMPGQ